MFELLNIVNLFLIIVLIIVVVISVYFIKKQYDYYNNELDKLNNDLQTLISEHKQNVLIENKIQELKKQDINNIEQDIETDKDNKDAVKTISDDDIDFKKILSDNNNAIMSILNIITENQENITTDDEENIEDKIDTEENLVNKLHDKEDVEDVKYDVSTFITKTDTDKENDETTDVYLKKYRVYDNIDDLDTISDLSDKINISNIEITENKTDSIVEDVEKSNVESEEKISSEDKINMCDVIIEEQNKKDEEFNNLNSFYKEEIKKDFDDIKIQTLRKMYKFYNINGGKSFLKYNKQELYDLIKNYIDK